MGTATVQLNTRIDPMIKAGGDAVLTRNGLGRAMPFVRFGPISSSIKRCRDLW